MSPTPISDVSLDRFLLLSERINTAIDSANEAVLETHVAIKGSREQVNLLRLALETDTDAQSQLQAPEIAPRRH